jgi:hypothetical protein
MKTKEHYEALDKRSREYKDWKKAQEAAPSGLGDTIEKITEATGIKAAVKFLAGEDCGCDARKDKLNKIFRYERPECLTEEEYNYLAQEMATMKNVVSGQVQKRMTQIYNRVFHQNKQATSCGSCFRSTYEALRKLMNEYN